ncbi:MAG: cytochrome c [Oligoflexia bacterium]|nr:cytochrome c [Oligoflexia bacterium]
MRQHLLVFTLTLGIFVPTSSLAQDFKKATPQLLEKGKASYMINCLTCHGEKGDGNGVAGQYMNPKPRDFAKAKFKKGKKPEQIFNTLTKGMDGTSMASFASLSEEERWAVAHYVLSFTKRK